MQSEPGGAPLRKRSFMFFMFFRLNKNKGGTNMPLALIELTTVVVSPFSALTILLTTLLPLLVKLFRAFEHR